MEHLNRQELEAYVAGVPALDVDRLRRHVSECPACARRLSVEARREVLLHEAMIEATGRPRETVRSFPETHVWLRPLAVAATLLVLAGAVWNLARRDGARQPVPAELLRVGSVAEIHVPDRLSAMPGSEVVSPRDLCRHVTILAGAVPGL